MPRSQSSSVYSASRPGTQRPANVSLPSTNPPNVFRYPDSRRIMNIWTPWTALGRVRAKQAAGA